MSYNGVAPSLPRLYSTEMNCVFIGTFVQRPIFRSFSGCGCRDVFVDRQGSRTGETHGKEVGPKATALARQEAISTLTPLEPQNPSLY